MGRQSAQNGIWLCYRGRPIGEAYNVVALPNHADCPVVGEDITLSQLYHEKPEWFCCDTEELPIRVNILDPAADLSVQLHPGDEYAMKHDHSRGKPECWVILDTPEDGYIEFGHHAKTREEFIQLAEKKDFEKLLKYLPAKRIGLSTFRRVPCTRSAKMC